jgi:hypothetical protein
MGRLPLFEGVRERLPLTLTASRRFTNGKMLLNYVPSGNAGSGLKAGKSV